jgi:hypothetical protein
MFCSFLEIIFKFPGARTAALLGRVLPQPTEVPGRETN